MLLLPEAGDEFRPGDEFYDNDEEQWFPVPNGMLGKVIKQSDIVRRNIGDIFPVLRSLMLHLEGLREMDVDKSWMDGLEQYVAEFKRRTGQRSIAHINSDGTVDPSEIKREPMTLESAFK